MFLIFVLLINAFRETPITTKILPSLWCNTILTDCVNQPPLQRATNFMEEIWKDIPEYEGKYQASTLGRIKSLVRKGVTKERILKDGDCEGYRIVGLAKNPQEHISTRVHILVARTFLPNPNNLPQVNHIDGVKNHNWVENLEWSTVSDNLKHSFAIGLKDQHGENHHNRKLNSVQVLEIRVKFKHRIYGRKKLALEYGVTTHTIKAIINRKIWNTI